MTVSSLMTGFFLSFSPHPDHSSLSRPFLIPEWSHAADGGGSGGDDGAPSGRLMTSTPRRPSNSLSSMTDAANLVKPRDLRLPSAELAPSRPPAADPDELARLADDILQHEDVVEAAEYPADNQPPAGKCAL